MKKILVIAVMFLWLSLPTTTSLYPNEVTDAASRLEKITPTDGKSMPAVIKEGLNKPIEWIQMAGDAEIRTFLRLIASLGSLNIVAHGDVSGKKMAVFLGELKNITVGDLLEIVLTTNDLAMEIQGNIINVMTAARFQTLYGRTYDENRQFKIIKLKNIKPSQAMITLETLVKSGSGQVGATIIRDDASQSLIVIAFPERIKQIEEVLETIDIPLETKVFEPKYAKASNIESLFIEAQVLSEIGIVKKDIETNKLFVTDTIDKLNEVTNLIKELDQKPRQVMIQTKMIQITLKDEFYMGVDWQKIFSGQSQWQDVNLVGKFPFPSDALKSVPTDTFAATIGTIPPDNFTGTVKLLQSFGDLKTISSPRLITLNNRPAKFMVGGKDFYVEPTRTTSEGTVTESFDITFIDVGITLAVTPTINADSFISMHLEPKITAVIDRVRTSTGDPVPITQETNVQVDVMVKNGVTIVIAGLIRDEKRENQTGIPIAKDLPLVGGLFRQTGKVTEKTETVIFLTPYIVSGDVDDSWYTKQSEMERKQPKGIRDIK